MKPRFGIVANGPAIWWALAMSATCLLIGDALDGTVSSAWMSAIATVALVGFAWLQIQDHRNREILESAAAYRRSEFLRRSLARQLDTWVLDPVHSGGNDLQSWLVGRRDDGTLASHLARAEDRFDQLVSLAHRLPAHDRIAIQTAGFAFHGALDQLEGIAGNKTFRLKLWSKPLADACDAASEHLVRCVHRLIDTPSEEAIRRMTGT